MKFTIVGLSLVILLSIILVSSCAVNKATLNSFVDPSFGKGEVKKLAIFPIRNTRLAPSEGQQINRRIAQEINRRDASIELMSAAEVISLLNEKNLADQWAIFLDNYNSSGVPNSNVLREIGYELEIDAIMQGEIVNIFQQDGSYGMNKGTTRVTVRFSMLGTKNGKLLWEASSDGIRSTRTKLESAPPVIEAVNLAVDKILSNLPL